MQKNNQNPTHDNTHATENGAVHHPQSNLLFCSSCIFVASLFLCTAFSVGANHSAMPESADNLLSHLRETDIDYISANVENEQLLSDITELTEQSLELQEQSGTLTNYEATKQSLEKKLDTLKADFQSKNDALYNLNQEVLALQESNASALTITLTPGVYKVDKNIPAGTYGVTSSGTIIAATAEKEAKINLQLNPDTETTVELKSNYTIKISASTKFVLSQTTSQ